MSISPVTSNGGLMIRRSWTIKFGRVHYLFDANLYIRSIYQPDSIYVVSYICTPVCAQSICFVYFIISYRNIIIQRLGIRFTLPGISRARCCQTSDGWELRGILQHPSSWWAKEMSSRLWSQWAVWLVELDPTTRPNQGGKVWRCEAESQQTFCTFYISSDFFFKFPVSSIQN